VTWRRLGRFEDRSIPKLHNLARASRAGLRVPETWWAWARELAIGSDPPLRAPCIVRSGSPTEDTTATSNAGQLLSLVVRSPDDFADALGRVVAALPRAGPGGVPQGTVFVQPLLEPEEAGVAFFDGFYFERTAAEGSNQELTAGQARGEVTRGHLARDDAWSRWLQKLHRAVGDGRAVDVEYARDGEGYVLLQARPALFEVRRNPLLSLANHKEILGDPPSPWITSVLCDAGREVLGFFAAVDRAVGSWGEAYAVDVAERAWMNFSFFFRLMDRWGLPRSFVTAGVGGSGEPGDERMIVGRFLRSVPRLVWLQLRSLVAVLGLARKLAALDARIDAARTLGELYAANVEAMRVAVSGNFAINSVLSGMVRVRKALRVRGQARVVTRAMMDDYGRLAALPGSERAAALDRWLERHGHRGPLESDPARPRFAELRAELLADSMAQSAPPPAEASRPGWITRPLYLIDERREWFRDQLMRRWQTLRARLLDEGTRLVGDGVLAAPHDVFLLRGHELAGDVAAAVAARRPRLEAARAMSLPHTAPRDTILGCMAAAPVHVDGRRVFTGIALHDAVFEGEALPARELTELLGSAALGPRTILVVPALEPSWAVVFGRVGGVVAEIGGELSHASILLREARRPAIVNCAGIFAAVSKGARLRIDGPAGVVELLDASPASDA
jgi:phosphohistidine swiveling domain-containing protein